MYKYTFIEDEPRNIEEMLIKYGHVYAELIGSDFEYAKGKTSKWHLACLLVIFLNRIMNAFIFGYFDNRRDNRWQSFWQGKLLLLSHSLYLMYMLKVVSYS